MKNVNWRIENINSPLILFSPNLPEKKEIKSKKFKIFMFAIVALIMFNGIDFVFWGK